MPLIQPKPKEETKGIRVKFPKDVLDEIEKYCKWANIQEFDHFVIESVKQIFAKDKDWRAQSGG